MSPKAAGLPKFGMHKYVICGPQGSGKGTQSELLCRDYDLVHISIGDIFRWNVKHHTKLAARIKRITDAGMLVPDEVVDRVVRDRLDQHDWNYGFVLDGFPRTRAQAEYLFENWNLDKVIYLELTDEVVFQRVMYRARMGQGSGFTKRADDNPEALMIRLREYHEKTKPLLELYSKLGMLITVDASQSISSIYADVRRQLALPDPNVADAVTV